MGRKVKDWTGQRFGKLVVRCLDPDAPRGKGHNAVWICDCDCGNETKVSSSNLNRKTAAATRSCGCLQGGHNKKYSTPEEKKAAAVARALAWNKANPERHSANRAAHYWRYPERAKQSAYRYLGRRTKQTCTCCSKDAFNDFYLKRPHGHEVDHIKPLSKGGAHCLTNLQYLLKHDNRVKGGRLVA